MSAEIVMIVENKNARAWIGFSMEIGGRETADTRPHHDEVVKIGIGFSDRPPVPPSSARQLMGDFVGAVVIAAQPGKRGRITGSSDGFERETFIGSRSPR